MITKRAKLFFLVLLSLFFNGCATAPYRPQATPSSGIYHIVGSGQTLYGISRAYGVEMKEIIRLNNIQDPGRIGVGEKLFIPRAGIPARVTPYQPRVTESVERLVGPKQYRVHWRSITLHHSATLEGNAEAFDRNHRNRGMGGLAYHFVIGNGTGSGDGEIEVGWRWIRQRQADRRGDIQVCVVGDFNREKMSAAQFNSLVKLLKVLIKEYSIPLSNIRRHKDVRGRITECPGDNFPFYRVLAGVRKA